jgi:drug/metabolite transporter (DMT)-like permease
MISHVLATGLVHHSVALSSGRDRLGHKVHVLEHRLVAYLDRADIPFLAVAESVAGALCFAASTVLQQTAARAQPHNLSMRPGLVVALARSWPWMLGNLLGLAGFVFQFLALRIAALALVEPLFVTSLVFSLAGAAVAERRRPSSRELRLSFVVVAGLGLFVSAAQPGPGRPDATGVGWGALFMVTATLCGAMVIVAGRYPRGRALWLGAVTGVVFGVSSAIIEYVSHLLGGGVSQVLSSWAPYALVGVGSLGILLNQSAYQAGELRVSLPVITVAEPIVAIVIGQALFGEHIGSSLLAVTGEVAGLVLITIGAVRLVRLSAGSAPTLVQAVQPS